MFNCRRSSSWPSENSVEGGLVKLVGVLLFDTTIAVVIVESVWILASVLLG